MRLSGDDSAPLLAPRRAASWWTSLEDLLWPQKQVVDKIKRRAEGFARAKFDTAINFGFHVRFDFSNYFGHLHAYFYQVCEELHGYGIKFMEHYSCNHVERPRGEARLRELMKAHRHHVLLFHDSTSAAQAQYEGYFFNDLCEVDLRDGSRGYAPSYDLEVFCHNNPAFLDMHRRYLQRLMKEVPFDGIQIDDMCDYAGLTTCGCKYCRDRFRREYGHEIPAFGAGYDDPVFRDWLRMKSDSVADHLRMIKGTLGGIPLMTCCSNAGPMVLNTIGLNLEKMAPYLDLFMLENVGIEVKAVDWMRMDAEAMYQKDVAEKNGNAPAITISYTISEKGGYLGWSLGRFWGVANWSSTLYGRLEKDPADAREVEDIMSVYNNWDVSNSGLDGEPGVEVPEVRLMTSSYCRDNGWRGEDGKEQWNKVEAWSRMLLKHNVGYRLLRNEELADGAELLRSRTPLILDSVACVSDAQLDAVKAYLSGGGVVWMAGPFGTHDEKGFRRSRPLSEALRKERYKGLVDAARADVLSGFRSMVRQVSGGSAWAVRVRKHERGTVLHFLSWESAATGDDKLVYEIDGGFVSEGLTLRSPELGDERRAVVVSKSRHGRVMLEVDLSGVQTYAVVQ